MKKVVKNIKREVRRLSKLALLLLFITSCSSIDTASKDNSSIKDDSYWKQRCLAAEKVLEETIECWDVFYDTVAEGDSYSNWMELYEE